MLAAMGGNKGDVRKKTKTTTPTQPSSMFTVTQSLVTLLTRNKWVSSVGGMSQSTPSSGKKLVLVKNNEFYLFVVYYCQFLLSKTYD